MQLPADQLFTQVRPVSRLGMFVQFPVVRILIALMFLVPVLAINKAFKMAVYPALAGNTVVVMRYIEAAVFFALFVVAYRLYVKHIEKRPALEMGMAGWAREAGAGFLISFVLVSVIVGLLAVFGCYRIVSWSETPGVAVDLLFKFFMGAFLEELLFRLVLFKLTEELLGSWLALALQALLFGFSHLANENATVFTSFAIAIIGGLVETAAYMYTRRIWFPLGLHWGWNYLQSGIFGMPNSGSAYDGLLIPRITGPAWLTGGTFGIEASYIAILLCCVTGAALVVRAQHRGQLVPLTWKRATR
jgi:membrane protease YdiL (CAAX protease family)